MVLIGGIAMADYFILNNRGIKELHDGVQEILKEIDF